MKNTIHWSGKAVFTVTHISKEEYSRCFDTDYITYHEAELSLEKLAGTQYALPADWFNRKYRILAADYLVYGPKWYKDGLPFPCITLKMECKQDGVDVDFYDLSLSERSYIISEIIENSKYSGRCLRA